MDRATCPFQYPRFGAALLFGITGAPPTAINRKDQFKGTSFGHGLNLNYSFQPRFLVNDQHFFVNIGVGYFKERFNVMRYFDYKSPLYLGWSTHHYSYYCWQWRAGLTYQYPLNEYALIANVSYNHFNSFRQQYAVSAKGSPSPDQVNELNIDFARSITLVLGAQRKITEKISIELSLVLPYTRWRNDRIFRDDPATFSKPTFSIGTSISIAYHFNKKQQ